MPAASALPINFRSAPGGFPDDAGDLSPRAAGWLLVGLFILAAWARSALNRLMPGPAVFTDELLYVEQARSFAAQGRMLFAGHPTYFPNWLYSMLLAPIVAIWPMARAHGIILAFNAWLGALTVLPAYFWAREMMDRRRALLAAALVALIPGMGYAGFVLTESPFIPAMTLALWLIHRSLMRPTFERCLLAGLASGLAFHIKAQGLLLPWIVFGGALWSALDALRARDASSPGAPPAAPRWRGFLGALLPHAATALGWALAMVPRILEVAWVEHPGQPLRVATVLGAYAGTELSAHPHAAWEYALSFLAYAGGWALASGLWPAWRLFPAVGRALALRDPLPMRRMAQLTALTTFAMLLLTSRHTLVDDDLWRLHERYYFVILPPVLILFAASPGAGRGLVLAPAWRGILLRLLLLIPFTVLCFQVMQLARWAVLTDSPTLGGFEAWWQRGYPMDPGQLAAFRRFGYCFAVLGIIALAVWILSGSRQRLRFAAVALLLVWFNFGWYGAQRTLARVWNAEMQSIARRVEHAVPPGDTLLVLTDGIPPQLVWNVRFLNSGREATFDAAHRGWTSDPPLLADDLRVLSPLAQDRTWLLASLDLKFNRRPANRFKYAALYKLDGPPPLVLDGGQPLAQGIQPAIDLAAASRPSPQGLRFTVLAREVPDAWRTGKAARIRLRLRNDSLFALPADRDFRLGYHWARQTPTGWITVGGGDDRGAALPRGLPRGEEFELDLDVKGPPDPGADELLSIGSLEIASGRFTWSTRGVLNLRERVLGPSRTAAQSSRRP